MADDEDDRPGFVTIQIPMHTARGLRHDARKRETTVPRLISDLVSVVVCVMRSWMINHGVGE
jgi:hypothetical protein